MKKIFGLGFAAAILLSTAWMAYGYSAQSAAQMASLHPGGPLTVHKIKDDLYLIEGAGGNVTLYITDDGVIMVDDKSDEDHDHLMEKVKSVTDKPVKFVFNTHYHGNHSGGNAKMMPSAQIIAQAKTRANLVRTKQPGLPNLVFDKELDLFLGGKEVRALYFGRGHTDGDAFIYLPADRVLCTGDMVDVGEGFPPLIDYQAGGSAKEWTGALDEMLKLDFDTVIPGLGPVANRQAAVSFNKDLKDLKNRVSEVLAQGKSKDEIAKMLTSEFHWDQLHMTRSLDGVIAEFRP